jgi:hypothetical protein
MPKSDKRFDIKDHIRKRTNPLWPLLGEFTVVFNEIEHLLDFSVSWMVDPWSRDNEYIGIFLKDRTNFNQKREMFYGLAKWRISHYTGMTHKKKVFERLDSVYKDLDKAAKIRNLILHTRWTWWEINHPEAIQRMEHDIIQDRISLSQIKKWTKNCWASYFELSDLKSRLRIGEIPGPRP